MPVYELATTHHHSTGNPSIAPPSDVPTTRFDAPSEHILSTSTGEPEKTQKSKGRGSQCLIYMVLLIAIFVIFIFFMIPKSDEHTSGRKTQGCTLGYVLLNETGYCYKVVTSKSRFDQAENICKTDGAHLASIHSEEENRLLADMSRKSSETLPVSQYVPRLNEQDEMIIGLHYANKTWQWSDGSKVDFLNWADGEPNRLEFEWTTALVTSKIALYNAEGQYWNNIPTDSAQRGFICKKNL